MSLGGVMSNMTHSLTALWLKTRWTNSWLHQQRLWLTDGRDMAKVLLTALLVSLLTYIEVSGELQCSNMRVFTSLHSPITRKDRWGTIDDFLTSSLHVSLFSTTLWESANSIPVHSLMLSSHLFFCLPLRLPLLRYLAR